jgi:NADH-quinone oxidoreductase subunit L
VGGPWLWAVGLAGALLTAAYSFRVIFIVFFGPAEKEPQVQPGLRIGMPLVVLAALSLAGGFVNLPVSMGGRPLMSEFLSPVFSAGHAHLPPGQEMHLQVISAVVALAGILVAWLLYLRFRAVAAAAVDNAAGHALRDYWLAGWGFDWLYDLTFVRPFKWMARVNRADFIDYFFAGLAQLAVLLHRGLSRTQTGEVRWYVAVLTLGAVILVAIVVLR